jgi:tRNA threonylcarbamoyladenosine biosynthesis protein TsaE
VKDKQKKRIFPISNNSHITKNADQTRRLGAKFAKLLRKGDIVFLNGDLGGGKTTFVQGIAFAFGNEYFVRSSSFTLISEYKAKDCKLFHLDLYRLENANIWDLGFEEYLYGSNISLIEWANRLSGIQDDKTWELNFDYIDVDKRKITIKKFAKSS